MTRRLHRCLTCIPQQPTPRAPFTQRRGYTRHADRVCAACRRDGVTVSDGAVSVHLQPVSPFALRLIGSVADPAAPTMAELRGGVDLTSMLANWHGTDCPCPACAADRKPGRSA